MAKFPNAEDHNIPPSANDPKIDARIICIHTMVGTMQSSEDTFLASGKEAHFGVAMDGRVWQWRDTSIQADSQFDGNGYCISIETEDKSDPANRWTAVQLDALVELITWIGEQHDIPFRLVKKTEDRGIGFHRQFPEWNRNNHSCPGDIRLEQLKKELIPALKDPSMSAADVEALKKHINKMVGNVPTGGIQQSLSNLAHGASGNTSLDSIAAQMNKPLQVDTKAIVAAIKSDPALIEAISTAVATKVAAHLRGGGPG